MLINNGLLEFDRMKENSQHVPHKRCATSFAHVYINYNFLIKVLLELLSIRIEIIHESHTLL
jgi:hypothetical protein